MTLTTFRDELRVRAHLAGMDARDGWARLERRWRRLERSATERVEAGATLAIASFELAKGKLFEIAQRMRRRGR